MVRLNITLPDDIFQYLKNVPNKSRFIAEALRERFRNGEKKKLEKHLIEGYKATSEEDERIQKEWEDATLHEGWA